MSSTFLDQEITYIKGVGPMRAELLAKEKSIKTVRDALDDFPFRYIDKTNVKALSEISSYDHDILTSGQLVDIQVLGQPRKKRLRAFLTDGKARIELVWFRRVKSIESLLEVGQTYVAYGKLNMFNGKKSIVHPELEKFNANTKNTLDPVYHSTEKLNQKNLGFKAQRRIIRTILDQVKPNDVNDNLPEYLLKKVNLCSLFQAYKWIHFPENNQQLQAAQNRLKFNEFFFLQLGIWHRYYNRKEGKQSYAFSKVGEQFNYFYNKVLPFELTNAQKKVIKEMRKDVGSGLQMNRLLQGDVGSGKTIVAFMTMLLAIDNGYQSCLMAPTEILAIQHFEGLQELAFGTQVTIELLTGSIRGKKRKEILARLLTGEVDILVGTHAVIEDSVQFKKMGLAITDEQHRFGVAQRARLWSKAKPFPPHILVMTATPIPRTLAMTTYGDLDVSVIDELPPGRKPIDTKHLREKHRPHLINFMKSEIKKGRQVYIVYPLIEESEALDLADLAQGYDYLLTQFERPKYQISIVHGKMKSENKAYEMDRFKNKKTQILIGTTVIEVGVNVPNASVMVIENAERFGLSQLHQLRGRVGRGAEQSYCILMSGYKLTEVAKKRLAIMCETNDGFRIAEEDLKLRGPGEVDGTRQSGDIGLKIANPITDNNILKTARQIAQVIIQDDNKLQKPINASIRRFLNTQHRDRQFWSEIS